MKHSREYPCECHATSFRRQTPGDIRHTLPHNLFIDVRVALENANHIVTFKQRKYLVSVSYSKPGVLRRLSGWRHIGVKSVTRSALAVKAASIPWGLPQYTLGV